MTRLDLLSERLRATQPGQWFWSLAPRDRRILLVLTLFLLALVMYFAFWAPIQAELRSAHSRHADTLADQRWILANRAAVTRLQAGRNPRSGQTLLTMVANSARTAGLTLNRFQPEGDDALSASLEDVALDELLPWLETLVQTQGLHISQVSIDASEVPGRVRVRLVLR